MRGWTNCSSLCWYCSEAQGTNAQELWQSFGLHRCSAAVPERLFPYLKILLYLYINIELIFDFHRICLELQHCNAATARGVEKFSKGADFCAKLVEIRAYLKEIELYLMEIELKLMGGANSQRLLKNSHGVFQNSRGVFLKSHALFQRGGLLLQQLDAMLASVEAPSDDIKAVRERVQHHVVSCREGGDETSWVVV